jgi:hypothetical protein
MPLGQSSKESMINGDHVSSSNILSLTYYLNNIRLVVKTALSFPCLLTASVAGLIISNMKLSLRYVKLSYHDMCILHLAVNSCSCLAAVHVKWAGSINYATELRREKVFRNLFVTTAVINKSFVICLDLQVKLSMVFQWRVAASFHSRSRSSFINRLNFRQYGGVLGITKNIILAPVPCILYYFVKWHSDVPALSVISIEFVAEVFWGSCLV